VGIRVRGTTVVFAVAFTVVVEVVLIVVEVVAIRVRETFDA
jgi:hypothetical protein